MPRIQLYLSDKEYEFIKSKPQGFVRDLVAVALAENGGEKVDYKAKKTEVTTEKSSRVPFEKNIYACPECNQVLCGGKCINKHCKRFKK